MKVYRVAKAKYAEDLSGRGAQRFGGRWNSKGVPALYTSQHRSLCILELLVHTSVEVIPEDIMLLEISLPEDLPFTIINLNQLPEAWNHFPFDDFTRQMGDEMLNQHEVAGLQVPSAVVEQEYNFVINPMYESIQHAEITELRPLALDERFFSNS